MTREIVVVAVTRRMNINAAMIMPAFVLGNSFAAVLMAAGAPGKRFALPNSRFLIHQPWTSGLQGQTADIEIHAKDMLKMRDQLNRILSNHTGQTIEKIAKDTDRDYILEAEEARKYGLVDAIYHRRDDIALKAAG